MKDFSLLEPSPDGTAAVEGLDAIPRPRAMYVGNLEPYQGIDLLLESFRVARERAGTGALVVVGGKPEDIAHYRAECVVGFDYNIAPYIGLLDSDIPKILNVIDSEILYYTNQVLTGNVNLGVLKHLTAAFLTGREHFRRCAAIVTVSPADTRNLQRYTGAKNVFTVPNGVDHKKFAPDSSTKTIESGPRVKMAPVGMTGTDCAPALMLMRANISGLSNPPGLGAKHRTLTVRVMGSTVGLMKEMLAGKWRSGYAWTVISTGCPTRILAR